MAYSRNEKLEKVYAAKTDAARKTAYNDWASDYDMDVSAFGIQLPYVGATVFARHVEMGSHPILDAGCGTGMHSLPLRLMGYSGFHGVDLSEGMLSIAKEREIYESLRVMALGSVLDFPDNHFSVTYSIGCLAPGNAPPNSLEEFIRVTKPGGLVIWSTHMSKDQDVSKGQNEHEAENDHRDGCEDDPTIPYHNFRNALSLKSKWVLEFETGPFVSMPSGDNSIKHNIYVYRVI